MNIRLLSLKCLIAGLVLFSCDQISPKAPEEDQILDGPVNDLTSDQKIRFLAGDAAFNTEIFTSETGLGSVFVATSCGGCHAGDGKGTPFTTLTRFGQTDETGNKFLHMGGPQLQNRALPGFMPETIPDGATFSKFTPPANTGLGFIELVSDEDILAMADPDDKDGDGISGVPNYGTLPDFVTPYAHAMPKNGKYIHRFGKKAAAYNLLHQTVNAYSQDIGISSTFSPYDVYQGHEIDPEVSNLTIQNVVFYLETLKAPIQRNQTDPIVQQGKQTFINIGCQSCHRENLKTGSSPVSALSNKTFHPFTDLLLHDMGSGLDDGYTEGSAKTAEWRTPPLWGLGLSPDSQGGQYYLMHDGRARSIRQAIQMHGGEGQASNNKFEKLTETDKNKLITFLESL
ncbi:di-heme oxidoredictase family protein [Dyadobacter sp. LHD-138]|uniref:di-heme oxidoredictase family protein n=1 Tax=Dyadobacter sp. LHD-138 TaxID=3071413 RepID=UPI0027E0ED4D|nr:di-heme oxidoredictase family protein [Dyadobacter sp. LHD-138]MDQ6480073.1 di-heme oxidoredictase family protein [Dyadobacter sp. LHD-138]